MMNKSDIDWCDFTWNPVTGCPTGCPYCYAKKQARRFCGDVRLNITSPQIKREPGRSGLYILEQPFKSEAGKTIAFPAGFDPTFHRYRLDMPARKKKPATIFVCSMGDLFHKTIPTLWIKEVMDACMAAPQHNYMFLTKSPQRYMELDAQGLLPHSENFWYGTTITRTEDQGRLLSLPAIAHRFVSIEPIAGPIDLGRAPGGNVDWIIVGAETGQRIGKVAPQEAWLKSLADYASQSDTPILLKESAELRAVWSGELIQQFPAGLEPMKPIDIPHCRSCKYATPTPQGKRGISYACEIGMGSEESDPIRFTRQIPGRYTRSSPPWCPRRKKGRERDGE